MKNKGLFSITEFSDFSKVQGQYSYSFIKNSKCVKVSEDKDCIKIAASENAIEGIETLRKLNLPKKTEIIFVKESDFAEFTGSFVEKPENKKSEENKKDNFLLEEINSDAPIVNIINAICLEAIRKKCSDIHIQCGTEKILVRMRIDGVLQTVKIFEGNISTAFVNRIKVMSGLNVMENRNCQDGRMNVTSAGKNFDFRVSIVPCVKGVSIVLRLFNLEEKDLNLEELGFSDKNFKKLLSALKIPNGMILVTGPTGSGKTTTLHSLISKMDREHLKIITIEDPVEKIIDGVEQIQVNEEIGLSFENILRRILRQDPDVIMVGEIRDKETAQLAVRAALTGHLILSTLHTNDSVGAIARLRNLGVETYLIADVLRICLSQRLVRKLCTECSGNGCEECNFTGYKGRTCVSEIFECDEKIKYLIETEKTENEIKTELIKLGFTLLKDDALLKVKEGITDQKEILKECVYEN